MQKPRKRNEVENVNVTNFHKQQHTYAVQPPDVITSDDLNVMLDDDLVVRLRTLEDERNRVLESHHDAKPWEEEIAYARREQQVRFVRRERHVAYDRKVQQEFNASDYDLPQVDFDNYAYVYAATGGKPPRWS